MKRFTIHALLALCIALAAVAWAGEPAVEVELEPRAAAEAMPVEAPELGADAEALIDGLVVETEAVGACCVADCHAEYSACRNACSDQACRIACGEAFDECASQC